MDGIRIRPQADRVAPDNAMVVIVDKTRPLPLPRNGRPLSDVKPVCGTCGVLHTYKTYHLQLRAGSVIVSPTIWGRLQGLVDNGGMEYVNPVAEPPTQRLDIGGNGQGAITLLEKFVTPIPEPAQGQP